MNIIIPPMKVTQRAAPQADEKLRTWASLMKVESFGEYGPSGFDPKVSGEKMTPPAKKATAVKNLVIQAISSLYLKSLVILEIKKEKKKSLVIY